MLRALTSLHRWLAIPLAPLFVVWFASGLVMHFVPYPTLSEAERIAGMAPIDFARVRHRPREAVAARAIAAATRLRLLQRADGPVYIVSGGGQVAALHADDLSPAGVATERLALAIARAHARERQLAATDATVAGLIRHDQWTVAEGLDPHRPLYRVALNDPAGTELYVSSITGEIVRDSTRRERRWNYLGSVAHWIYPTWLRARPRAWTAALWLASGLASVAAIAGAVLGPVLLVMRRGLVPPVGSLRAWHHAVGLFCAAFVLSWIVTGWLTLDHGLVFAARAVSPAEAAVLAPAPDWDALPADAPIPAPQAKEQAKEIEWFFFNAAPYRRDRFGLDAQALFADATGPQGSAPRTSLTMAEIAAVARRLPGACSVRTIDADTDGSATASVLPGAPVYRIACDDLRLDVDGASGVISDRLDPARRLAEALHTLDIPALSARPALRSALVIGFAGCGLAFSLTGCVLAWRRLSGR
jgi:PepSY-associated TM region